MATILIRTLIVYVSLMAMMRFMGKRQLGELEISELITTLLLSEIASLPITNPDTPLAYALLPILTLVALEVLLSGLLLKIPALKNLLAIRPAILIHHGKVIPSAMRSIRISADELVSQLRLKNVTDPSTVEYAILEPNGQISIILRATERQATTEELGIASVEEGMMHLIIADGKINQRNLRLAGKNQRWLDKYLSEQRIRLKDVFMLMADDAGQVRLYPRDGA